MQIIEVPLAQIVVGDRLREVDEEQAKKIANSFREIGQLEPIGVRPDVEDGRYDLVYGAHRFRAAQIASLETIDAIVEPLDDDQARLREIDENLYRHELTPYDQAAFIDERISILERIHGKRAPGRPKKGANLPHLRNTAEQFELSLRDVKRALKRRQDIGVLLWRALRGTIFVRKGSDLDKLAKLPPHNQERIARWLQKNPTAEGARNVDALFEKAGLVTPRSKVDGYAKLLAAWNHATPSEQQRFRDWLVKSGEID